VLFFFFFLCVCVYGRQFDHHVHTVGFTLYHSGEHATSGKGNNSSEGANVSQQTTGGFLNLCGTASLRQAAHTRTVRGCKLRSLLVFNSDGVTTDLLGT
jgi:hypothetical protein